MLVVRNLLLLASYLFAKRRCVRDGVLEIVLSVGIGVDTDGQNVSSTGPLQTIRSYETAGSVLAFDVITIEPIGHQVVLSGDDRYLRIQGCRSLSFQYIAAPNLYERTVTEEPHIARPAPRFVIFVGRLFSYFNLYRQVAI